jgi:hypothetical protein
MFSLSVTQAQRLRPRASYPGLHPPSLQRERHILLRNGFPVYVAVAPHLIYSWKESRLLVVTRNCCYTSLTQSLRGFSGRPVPRGSGEWGVFFQRRLTLTLWPIGHEATVEPQSLLRRKTATLFPCPGRDRGHYSLGNKRLCLHASAATAITSDCVLSSLRQTSRSFPQAQGRGWKWLRDIPGLCFRRESCRPWHLATTPMYGIGNGIALPIDPTFNPACRHRVDGRALALNYAF